MEVKLLQRAIMEPTSGGENKKITLEILIIRGVKKKPLKWSIVAPNRVAEHLVWCVGVHVCWNGHRETVDSLNGAIKIIIRSWSASQKHFVHRVWFRTQYF